MAIFVPLRRGHGGRRDGESRAQIAHSFALRIFLPLLLLVTIGCSRGGGTPNAATATGEPQPSAAQVAPVRVQYFGYEIVKSYPHDPTAFTQGLLYHQGVLYESTGLNGKSSLRRVDLETGRVDQKVDLLFDYFAEGLALSNRKLYQLTWRSRLGFIYDLETMQLQKNFNYRGEGWGLTSDGHSLILSDGTNKLRFLDPETLDNVRELDVLDGDRPIDMLNELEFINGEIWANIWQSDKLVRINPNNGRVTAWINLSGLLQDADRTGHVDVLNGIAWDESGQRLFVTGKLWPKIYEIRLVQKRVQVER